MNARYRKRQRLRSRHARRGHKPWCNCPEQWARTFRALNRYRQTHGELPTRTVHTRTGEPR